MFGHDPSRHGVDAADPAIQSVRRRWSSVSLDGAVYGQPLIAGSTVIATTEADTVYALSAANGQLQWRTNLGTPVPGGDLPCGDIDPSGITSTPVIDRAARTVWVVAFVQPAHHELVALDLDTGSVRSRVNIDPPGSDPKVEQQRGALLLENGTVYVPYGGLYGDCGDYHGWVVGARTDGTGGLLSWQVPSGREAGIWAPGGAVADAAGDIVATTGNSASSSTFDDGNAVVRLSANLQQLDWFAPPDWATLNAHDADLGSTSPALVGPNGSEVFQIGKTGIGYLLALANLGHVTNAPYSASVCGGAFGATAFSDPVVYVPCVDGIRAVTIGPGLSFRVRWNGPGGQPGSPVVAAGAVWYLDTGSNEGQLVGLDPATGKVRFRVTTGSVVHFASPAAGDGLLVVAAGGRIQAFGA
jgi:outer membrane protein assembly factor BamB